MANHPVLAKDPDLRFFLESDTFALDVSVIYTMPDVMLTKRLWIVDQTQKGGFCTRERWAHGIYRSHIDRSALPRDG